MIKTMGIDGCRAGWFAVTRHGKSWQSALAPSLSALLADQAGCERIMIDIPIGLADHQQRECDRLARRLLSPLRHSSIFSTPVRDAVYAPDYRTACEINARQTGKRISQQSWHICPKIREVDKYLHENPGLQQRIYESHPEVAFYALNGQQPLATRKKSRDGQEQRLSLLEQHIDNARQLYYQSSVDYPRSQLQCDDILDAMVLAVIADRHRNELISLPATAPVDRFGLPMQIAYSIFQSG